MLSKCFNPACHKKLDYLRYGRVVRTVRTSATGKSVEHYWLCGSAMENSILSSKPTGVWLAATETAQMPLRSTPLSTTSLDEADGRVALSLGISGNRKSRKIL